MTAAEPVPSVHYAENVSRNDVVRHVTHCVLAKERPSKHQCSNCLLSLCRHCQLWGRVGEDHTCPCPFHDNDCKEHPA